MHLSETNQSIDSKKRFTDRVADYVKFRPSYPADIITFLKDNSILTDSSVVADIGSGTGFLTKLFLDNGNKVFGVEPNKEMRLAGERFLEQYDNFVSITGSSEETTLTDQSIDVITAGQAYHWFDVEKTAHEFKRILKQSENNNIVLIWNTRTNKTEFNRKIERIIKKYSTDYNQVSHTQDKNKEQNIFFNKTFTKINFPNYQKLTFEGLLGRLASSSYMLKKTDSKFPAFEKDLKEIFIHYEVDGHVLLDYETELFYGMLD